MTVNYDSSTYGRILAAAFKAAGWTAAGRPTFGVQRFDAPASPKIPDGWCLYACTDPSNPDFDAEFNTALDALAEAEKRGEQARKVLDRLAAEGVIS